MSTSNNPNTSLSLTEDGRQLLEATLSKYIAFLRRQPAVCGTPEQQQALIKHVAQGQDLIKLVANERLNITRELDHQKHKWMEVEKQLTAPIITAMQPLKDAVEHYNREVMRVRQHQLAEGITDLTSQESAPTDWLTAQVELIDKPKGVRTKWLFQVVDPSLVPNGYWMINEGAIKTDIANGARKIPGIYIYEDIQTTFSQ